MLEKKEEEIQNITNDFNSQIDAIMEENKNLSNTNKKFQKEQQDLEHEYLTILE